MVHQESDSAYDKFVMGLRDYEQASALVQMQMGKFLSEFVFIAESALNMRKDGFFSDGTWAGIEGGHTRPAQNARRTTMAETRTALCGLRDQPAFERPIAASRSRNAQFPQLYSVLSEAAR